MGETPKPQGIITIGVPTHFRIGSKNVSACGIVHPQHAAYDGRDVDCVRCRKTKAWKTYMGKSNSNKSR